MKKIILLTLAASALLFVVIFSVRFFLGGDEDTWICVNGEWVKHGNPDAPRPSSDCGQAIGEIDGGDQQPTSSSECKSTSGKLMKIDEALDIARKGCTDGEVMENYVCNDVTGTWWIDFTPNEVKEGCNPACVVDIESKTAEVNWRCTGLIPKTQ